MDPITALLALAGITLGPRLMLLFGIVRTAAKAAGAATALRDAIRLAETLDRFKTQLTPEEQETQKRYLEQRRIDMGGPMDR